MFRADSKQRPLRLLLATTVLLSACSPAARVYSVAPVDREGSPIDAEGVDLLLLENGTRRHLLAGETLVLEGDDFVVTGAPERDGTVAREAHPVTSVEAVRERQADGSEVWIDVLTPDDLDRFHRLPRIQSIDTATGEHVVVDADDGVVARWSADRLAILVGREGFAESTEIPLDQVARVELFEPDLVGSTLRSPAFWLVGAAAAGLAIWLAGAEDEDSLATR